MSQQLFNGINGFALKSPSQYDDSTRYRFVDRRETDANNKEFIEITKEKNKLPRVTLRTYVLYYRNNGNTMTTTAPGVGSTVDDDENYRFYNDNDEVGYLIPGTSWIVTGAGGNVNFTWSATNQQASSTSGNGVISGTNAATFYIRRHPSILNGANLLVIYLDGSPKGYGFAANDTISFNASDHSWLDTNFSFTVTAAQLDAPEGRQLGWIWGFPLFDVSGGSGSWPRFESCYSNDANDISGNQKMLVNISDKQNIIVLDMSKFQFKDSNGTEYGDGFEDIKMQDPSLNDMFYMILRITGSSENSISYGGTQGTVKFNANSTSSQIDIGKNGNWPPCWWADRINIPGINRYSNKWCTLVEYEFYCDLINPKSFLDFTPNFFSFDFTETWTIQNQQVLVNGRRFIETQQKSSGGGDSYISNDFETGKTINNYTERITLKIKTGLEKDTVEDGQNRLDDTMSPGNIIKGLTLHTDPNNVGYANRLKEKDAWMSEYDKASWTVAKIIGGWYSRGDSNNDIARNIGYYGNIQNPGGNRTTKYDQTISWKNDIIFNNAYSLNKWPNLDISSNYTNYKTYNLNNLLWCSLRSPRKIKVNYIGNDNGGSGPIGKHRFITNFIDLKSQTSNEILGGGYARNPNELDLPRKSINPYFSKYKYQTTTQIINSNTVGIVDFDIDNNTQYLDASKNNNGNVLSLSDINYYKIQYKLLIPPGTTNFDGYRITYHFGTMNGGCVTTFFRFTDMSGTPNPNGNNNHFAVRDAESIELMWLADETDIKTIYITDIASGNNITQSTINTNSTYLLNANYGENYDLSFNVFQLHFFSRNTNNETITTRNELPYSLYTFDTTSSDPKFIDISYTPVDYIPYRYMNYQQIGSLNSEVVFFPNDFSVGPIYTREERILYNPGKIFPRGSATTSIMRTNAVVIDPSNTDVFPTVNIDISGDIIFDNSFSVVPNQLTTEEAADPENQGQEIATFDKQFSPVQQPIVFTNDRQLFQLQGVGKNLNGSDVGLFFYEPLQLMLDDYLIPDYWRLPNKLNILRTSNDSGSSTDFYRYYNFWENQARTSMVFDILSIVLKVSGGPTNVEGKRVSNILVNTNINARGSSEYSAITATGALINNKQSNIVYEVQGAFGVPPTDYLNLEPIIVLIKAPFNGPFGTIGQNFIGNKATAQGGINVPYPEQPGIPQNDSKFIVNTVLLDTFRRGNNLDGSDLGGSDTAYNGIFEINSEVPNKEDYGLLKQNNSFIGTIIGPSPLPVLLVDISAAVQLNATQFDMLNDENNTVTIEWSGFSFSKDSNWAFGKSDIYWSISRYNLSAGNSKTLLIDTPITFSNDKYTFIDTTPVIFTKYRYTVTGVFRWTGITDYVNTTEIPYLNVPGFDTPDILVCKYNRFPYGRFNTTSTNLKLYAPLLLTTPQGQVDQHGNKIGGPCQDPNNPSLNLFTRTSRISSSNNIYANTTNQVSKKQTYVILAKSRFRPFR